MWSTSFQNVQGIGIIILCDYGSELSLWGNVRQHIFKYWRWKILWLSSVPVINRMFQWLTNYIYLWHIYLLISNLFNLFDHEFSISSDLSDASPHYLLQPTDFLVFVSQLSRSLIILMSQLIQHVTKWSLCVWFITYNRNRKRVKKWEHRFAFCTKD